MRLFPRASLIAVTLAAAIAFACGAPSSGTTTTTTPLPQPPLRVPSQCCQAANLLSLAQQQIFVGRVTSDCVTTPPSDLLLPQCEFANYSNQPAGTSIFRCRNGAVPLSEPASWEPTGNTQSVFDCDINGIVSFREEVRKRPVTDATEKYCCQPDAILSRAKREAFISSRSQGVGCTVAGESPAVCNYTNYANKRSGDKVWRCVDPSVPPDVPATWKRTATPLHMTSKCGINAQEGAEEELQKK